VNDVADKTGVTVVNHKSVSVLGGSILGQVVRGGNAVEFLQHLFHRRRIVFFMALLKDANLDVVRRIRDFVERADFPMYLGTGGRGGIGREYKFLSDAVDFAFRQLLMARSTATGTIHGDNTDD
jgi:hypothetical protein